MAEKKLIKSGNTELQSKPELFVSLFEADKSRLYAYIFAYMMNHAAADDIFQETSMALWREFDKFTPGTNFSKWANGIAFNRVRVFRRKNKNYALGLSEELMESLTQTISEESNVETRWTALQQCRSQLRTADQELYDDFYKKNLKAQEVADQSGRSIFAIRKAIHKLRKKLFDCVDRKKSEGLV
jgi:RNA polymerase sigma-70 factor (ECF subfamily)